MLSAPVFAAAMILKMVTLGSIRRKCILGTSCKWKLGGMLRLSRGSDLMSLALSARPYQFLRHSVSLTRDTHDCKELDRRCAKSGHCHPTPLLSHSASLSAWLY